MYLLNTILPNSPSANPGLLRSVSIVAVLMLTGCSTVPPGAPVQIAVTKTKLPKAKPNLPNPKPINLNSVEWKVITPDTLPTGDYVYYGVTPKGYETLARNRADTIRFAKEAMWRLRYYRGETK